MKKIKYIFAVILTFCVILSFAGCRQKPVEEAAGDVAIIGQIINKEQSEEPAEKPKEKNYVGVFKDGPFYSREMMLEDCDLILRGTVTEKVKEYMTNPDNSIVSPDGYTVLNALVIEYTVQIHEIYKGTYGEETITVKTKVGDGLSPDLILYGEDETSILETPINRQPFEIGKECIFILGYLEPGKAPSEFGYYPFSKNQAYYLRQEDGTFVNKIQGVLNPATLPQEIADAPAKAEKQRQEIAEKNRVEN